MSDLRVRFGVILAIALFPILLFAIFMAYSNGRIALLITSLLAWIFAYFAIWIATDRLVFVHLRKIRIASEKFARGKLDTRIGKLSEAPQRIQELAEAFDNMAENISDREARLHDNLEEKETLLREIHHRVKNNLQIIISLLNMQERKVDDNHAKMTLQETRARINSIALVHRGLYEGNDIRHIEMRAFLTRLVGQLKSGFGMTKQGVKVTVAAESLKLHPDKAIPTALFIVEALTNAAKHGVQDGGEIIIRLFEEVSSDQTIVKASVKDNGEGPPQKSSKGTGTKLISGFARQLSGKIEKKQLKDGYEVALSFPK